MGDVMFLCFRSQR